MFDFRYHVASLAAVFLALVVGIVIGVGLSGQDVLESGERRTLNERIGQLRSQLEAARTRAEERRAAEQFVEAAYDAVMDRRLDGRRIAVLFVGRADDEDSFRSAILRTIDDADGTLVRLRVLRLPVDSVALDGNDARRLGEQLGREFVAGGDTPVWDDLASTLVVERGGSDEPADAVVVARTAEPQQGLTAGLLRGLYAGLRGSVPDVVWVEKERHDPPLRPAGLSSVENVDSRLGRVTLAVLLAGEARGSYGPNEEHVVPSIEPVPPPSG